MLASRSGSVHTYDDEEDCQRDRGREQQETKAQREHSEDNEPVCKGPQQRGVPCSDLAEIAHGAVRCPSYCIPARRHVQLDPGSRGPEPEGSVIS